ncbi:hypothetical protein [Geodermatophilus saharensis]|uniref:hypothetical protein n=1 Tax=Geodermatophilus saharensis TaxID=1137994 RepID=UPI0011401B53|nr:hypothetical protein [Geodermatophilus saharensis]
MTVDPPAAADAQAARHEPAIRHGRSFVGGEEPHGFTDEATAAFAVEVQRYRVELEVRARGQSQREVVVKDDVATAIKELRPRSVREKMKVAADWTKRVGFMFIGFAVVQFDNVHSQAVIDSGSVNWLVADAVAATVLVTSGFALDRASLRSGK